MATEVHILVPMRGGLSEPLVNVPIGPLKEGPRVLAEEFEAGLPDRFLLGSLLDRRLRLVQPLEVAVSRHDQQVVVEARQLGEVGWGDNLGDALTDLQRAIAELYYGLAESRDRLGPELAETWKRLQLSIAPRG